MTEGETTSILASAQALCTSPNAEDHTQAIKLLKGLTISTRPALDPVVLQKMERTNIMGLHLGPPEALKKCPFGRAFSGVTMAETDPLVLVDSSYAEWRTAQTHRRTVIAFKASIPVLIFRNLAWKTSPVRLPNGEVRGLSTRHYIAKATVISLSRQQEFDMTTRIENDGFIRPVLMNPRLMNLADPFISYVVSHRRDRKSAQQPMDKLE